MKLRKNSLQPLRLDTTGAFIPEHGIDRKDLEALYPQLEAFRDAIALDASELLANQHPISVTQQQYDAGFVSIPERLLSEYEADRRGSQLGRLFRMATSLHASVDRVVVLDMDGSCVGARALMDSCCQPYWNELSRADRGSRPRMVMCGNCLDNDSVQGLLYLLGEHFARPATSESDRWALVVVSQAGDKLDSSIPFRQLLSALDASCGSETDQLKRLLIPVTGDGSRLHQLARELGCREVFTIPAALAGSFTVLSASELVPAALLGINVIELLGGAAEMTRHFRQTPASDNVVLQHVAVNHLLERQRSVKIRVMSVWSQALESLGLWYDHLSAEVFGGIRQGRASTSIVNACDPHARSRQHRDGPRDIVVNHCVVDKYRFDSLAIRRYAWEQESSNANADTTLPDILADVAERLDETFRSAGCPSTVLHIPRVDELHVGQLLQMLMLATVVEKRLIENNETRS